MNHASATQLLQRLVNENMATVKDICQRSQCRLVRCKIVYGQDEPKFHYVLQGLGDFDPEPFEQCKSELNAFFQQLVKEAWYTDFHLNPIGR